MQLVIIITIYYYAIAFPHLAALEGCTVCGLGKFDTTFIFKVRFCD